jgi:hypothetical protein
VRRLLALAVLTAVVAVVLGAARAAVASAAEYSPPGGVADPPLESPACREGPSSAEQVYGGRGAIPEYEIGEDVLSLCRVLRYQLAAVTERQFWQLDQAVADREGQSGQLRRQVALLEQLTEVPPPSIDGLGALEHTDESGFLSVRYALWFLAGLGVMLLGGYVIVRLVVFRDN